MHCARGRDIGTTDVGRARAPRTLCLALVSPLLPSCAHACVLTAALQMPPTLLAQPTLGVAPDQAHRAAFQDVNRALRASKVDDSLSGTTAITAFVRGATLLVANVGDSRACMAEQHGRKLTAFNLSCDQTPFRYVRARRGRAWSPLSCAATHPCCIAPKCTFTQSGRTSVPGSAVRAPGC